ncbi:hypothetical protein L0B52_02595 [Suttonella sp. R2A3]|uniref:hypothetical protein n=1 Tax=Suttonella sp. R2A3 TaxID=2908648 RepID=UPI001F28A870|nr:hypothetical protein [Suttonella sp. R2A3]UJF25050.1 hypothetical protein L0B52_02595 [Suttonella sp. R2A3]
MFHKIVLTTAVALTISACGVIDGRGAGSHNLSRGTCENISICEQGQSDCRVRKDTMTQNHCEMVGGTFTPANHDSGWL